MDIEIYNRWEKMLKLREKLLAVDEDRMAGRKGYMLDELDVYLDDVIGEVQYMWTISSIAVRTTAGS